jgi:hypothetical protein
VNLQNAKLFYVISCSLLSLIILLPTLFAIFPLPEGEKFSELYLLGPNHMIESGALDVSLNKPYTFHLGVSNHMGGLEYYTVLVKLRSQSQAFKETVAELPSSLEPVYEYRLFLSNNETWEKDFVFSFVNVSFEENISRVLLLSINGNDVSVDEILVLDEIDGGFYCQMLFELWITNSTSLASQYHNRFVEFWINIMQYHVSRAQVQKNGLSLKPRSNIPSVTNIVGVKSCFATFFRDFGIMS